LVACVSLAACLPETHQCQDIPSDPSTETFAPSLGVNLAQMERTNLGDYRSDLVVGTGPLLSALAQVEIHYTAYLVDGTMIDQFLDAPVPLNLSTQSTIGLADGMLGMNVGGQRLIVVPSELALGACQNGTVPANSTIIYRVELVSIDS
jgi:FKBP-type peptidyl-prolyl cis-trans isomerase